MPDFLDEAPEGGSDERGEAMLDEEDDLEAGLLAELDEEEPGKAGPAAGGAGARAGKPCKARCTVGAHAGDGSRACLQQALTRSWSALRRCSCGGRRGRGAAAAAAGRGAAAADSRWLCGHGPAHDRAAQQSHQVSFLLRLGVINTSALRLFWTCCLACGNAFGTSRPPLALCSAARACSLNNGPKTPLCSTIVGLMTEDQLDRYEAFRRSSLKRPMRQVRTPRYGPALPAHRNCAGAWRCALLGETCLGPRLNALRPQPAEHLKPPDHARPEPKPHPHPPTLQLVKTVTNSSANPNDKLMIAVSSVAKTFVGDLIESGERKRSTAHAPP